MNDSALALPAPTGVVPRRATREFRVLPGFGLTLGYTVVYVSLLVLIPLSAVFFRSAELGLQKFWQVVTTPRVPASRSRRCTHPMAGSANCSRRSASRSPTRVWA